MMLEREILLLESLRQKRKQLELQIEMAQQSVLREMDDAGLDTAEVMFSGNFIRATIVQPTRVKHNEEKMEEMLEPSVWELVTTRHIDGIKLEAAVRNRLIDPATLIVCSSVHDSKRYIRVTS